MLTIHYDKEERAYVVCPFCVAKVPTRVYTPPMSFVPNDIRLQPHNRPSQPKKICAGSGQSALTLEEIIQ